MSEKNKDYTLFGEIALAIGIIDQSILAKALEIQREEKDKTGKRLFLGQVLVRKKYLRLKDIRFILNIQKELLVSQIEDSQLDLKISGDQLIEKARCVVLRKEQTHLFLPLGLFVILIIVLMNQPDKSTFPKPSIKTSKEAGQLFFSQEAMEFAPLPMIDSDPAKTNYSTDLTSLVGETLSDQMRGIFSRGVSAASRRNLFQKVFKNEIQEVFSELEVHIKRIKPGEIWFYHGIIQAFSTKEPYQFKSLVIKLLSDKSFNELGFALLGECPTNLFDLGELIEILLKGLLNDNGFIREKTMNYLQNQRGQLPKEIIDNLWEVVFKDKDPRLVSYALKVIYKNGENQDYSKLFDLLKEAHPRVKNEIVRILFGYAPKKWSQQLFDYGKKDREFCALIIKTLGVYPIKNGDQFLLEQLDRADFSLRLDIIHALGGYKGKNVIKSLVGLLDSNSTEQAVAIRSLRKITSKNFGYHFGASSRENKKALESWMDMSIY